MCGGIWEDREKEGCIQLFGETLVEQAIWKDWA